MTGMGTGTVGPFNPTSALRNPVVRPQTVPGGYPSTPSAPSSAPVAGYVRPTAAPRGDVLSRWRGLWKRKPRMAQETARVTLTGAADPAQISPRGMAYPAGGNVGAYVFAPGDHSSGFGTVLWPPPLRIPRVVSMLPTLLAGPSSIDGFHQFTHDVYVPNAYQTRVPRTSTRYRKLTNRNRSGPASGLLHLWSPKIQPDVH